MNELGLLYRYLPTELAPPAEAWNRLEKVLNDTERGLLQKINTVELSPPANAWEKIALALDEDKITINNTSFADKFLGAEIAPPAIVWDKIEQSLDSQTPVRKIAIPARTRKMVAIGLSIAACLTGVVFFTINKLENQTTNQATEQLAKVQKTDGNNPQTTIAIPKIKNIDSQQPPSDLTDKNRPKYAENNLSERSDDFPNYAEREASLEKTKTNSVPLINSTNNKVASFTGKLKDANGNIIDRISDYVTSSGYIAAIGPNGNPVNVSSKLANMIEFFREDSVANTQEEYLDKVMRESNVWRLKWLDWRKKVEAADANPSQMNFLDPIDLIRFFQKSK
jgi:hypothetical protein